MTQIALKTNFQNNEYTFEAIVTDDKGVPLFSGFTLGTLTWKLKKGGLETVLGARNLTKINLFKWEPSSLDCGTVEIEVCFKPTKSVSRIYSESSESEVIRLKNCLHVPVDSPILGSVLPCTVQIYGFSSGNATFGMFLNSGTQNGNTLTWGSALGICNITLRSAGHLTLYSGPNLTGSIIGQWNGPALLTTGGAFPFYYATPGGSWTENGVLVTATNVSLNQYTPDQFLSILRNGSFTVICADPTTTSTTTTTRATTSTTTTTRATTSSTTSTTQPYISKPLTLKLTNLRGSGQASISHPESLVYDKYNPLFDDRWLLVQHDFGKSQKPFGMVIPVDYPFNDMRIEIGDSPGLNAKLIKLNGDVVNLGELKTGSYLDILQENCYAATTTSTTSTTQPLSVDTMVVLDSMPSSLVVGTAASVCCHVEDLSGHTVTDGQIKMEVSGLSFTAPICLLTITDSSQVCCYYTPPPFDPCGSTVPVKFKLSYLGTNIYNPSSLLTSEVTTQDSKKMPSILCTQVPSPVSIGSTVSYKCVPQNGMPFYTNLQLSMELDGIPAGDTTHGVFNGEDAYVFSFVYNNQTSIKVIFPGNSLYCPGSGTFTFVKSTCTISLSSNAPNWLFTYGSTYRLCASVNKTAGGVEFYAQSSTLPDVLINTRLPLNSSTGQACVDYLVDNENITNIVCRYFETMSISSSTCSNSVTATVGSLNIASVQFSQLQFTPVSGKPYKVCKNALHYLTYIFPSLVGAGYPANKSMVDVYYPSTITDVSAPIKSVIVVHGGGWDSQYGNNKDNSWIVRYCDYFASRGFAVFSINYFQLGEATNPVYPKQTQELMLCIDAIYGNRANLHVQGFVVVGQSAGAYNALTYATTYGTKPLGYILESGLYDFTTITYTQQAQSFIDNYHPQTISDLGLLKINPKKVFLIYGTADSLVPIQNDENLTALFTSNSLSSYIASKPLSGQDHGIPSDGSLFAALDFFLADINGLFS